MNSFNKLLWIMAMLTFSFTFHGATPTYAQYEISWYTVDGGGGQSVGGTLELDGTIGQVDAGVLAGGSFELRGGFWTAAQESILLGDVNLDSVVNLLDVDPFIDRISTGTYQAEADINEDGVVNLLDVDPFILLLSG